MDYKEGQRFLGGRPVSPIAGANSPNIVSGPINTSTDALGHGAVMAVDVRTGQKKWKWDMVEVTDAGILTTAGDVLFTGGREGYFNALDARTGTLLWKVSVGGQISAAPVTYELDGKQYVAIAAGHALFVYGLKE